MANSLCVTCIFNSLCNTVIRHILNPFCGFFSLPLKDLSFIIYSGQLIYCTEFAKHSALQYRLFVSLHKMFFFLIASFCSCAQPVSSSPLTWIVTSAGVSRHNYFIAIQCTGSVNGAATATPWQYHPIHVERWRHTTPLAHAVMLCWCFFITLKTNLKVEYVM